MRFGGTLKGDQAGPGAVDTFGRPIDPAQYYRTQIQPGGDLLYIPTLPPTSSVYRFGQDREAIAKSIFNKRFAELTSGEAGIVIREEQGMLRAEGQARAEGTGQGRFNTPADLSTAQQTGVQVGTTPAQVAGQNVPTTDDRERRRGVEELKTTLEDIRDRLLVALPKQDELAGLLPGAALQIRRRSPQYREAIGQLEAAVNQIVNVNARVVGQQRGAQTERDALRAEAAIVNLNTRLTDPAQGDTQESAAARINETQVILDRILGQLPETPVPTLLLELRLV